MSTILGLIAFLLIAYSIGTCCVCYRLYRLEQAIRSKP